MLKLSRFHKLVVATVLLSASVFVSIAHTAHWWGGYHWARDANSFVLKLGDNVTNNWDSYLVTTSNDWSVSSVLDTSIVLGQSNPKNCRPTSGRVEVCNNKYGNNGWLGVAQVWVSGSHITQAITKMNDTYFNTPKYNTPSWRQFVVCQEIGHTFGLDHQDENFSNPPLGTCMDYTNDPALNQHPDQHDYDELAIIYSHLDSTMTVGQAVAKGQADDTDFRELADWGREIKKSANKRTSLYERDLGKGHKVFTFVIWAN